MYNKKDENYYLPKVLSHRVAHHPTMQLQLNIYSSKTGRKGSSTFQISIRTVKICNLVVCERCVIAVCQLWWWFRNLRICHLPRTFIHYTV